MSTGINIVSSESSQKIATSPLSVCKEISLQIKDSSPFGGGGGIIVAEPLPEKLYDVSSFVGKILPRRKIEYLGRKKMICLDYPDPSSLFFQTVHQCFSRHYPLALRPEVLMHMIVCEIATTVKMNPEHYRDLFTQSTKREDISVRHDNLRRGDPDSPWDEALKLFRPKLEKVVPSAIMSAILPEFSTSTAEADIASLIAFMDAASPYYDYHTYTMCGISEIRMLGSVDDYERMLEASKKLSGYFSDHLGLYFKHLLSVLEALVDQARGAPVDEKFWSSIYKFKSESGTSRFNGWMSAFINYIQPATSIDVAVELVQKPDKVFDWTRMNEEVGGCMVGLDAGCVPSDVSSVPFTWHYLEDNLPMTFIGGVLGIDNEDGYATPALSYGILNQIS
ncbi:hypothetical protein COB55_02955 [Candidatus Wolfebacteria bacterium]|nr:MAG: hypothetical protein COB55_02955 [Candidatus Wolfebacteria bacterium]